MREGILALVLVAGSGGSAVAQQAEPEISGQFLSLSVMPSLTHANMVLHVGLRERPPEKVGRLPDASLIWFAADFSGADPGDTKRRWTDGRRCPAAVPVLQRVEMLSGPSPRIPLEGGRPWGGSVLDGTWYTLNVQMGVLGDQSVGPVRIESNVGTDLARWAHDLTQALKPCWSDVMPMGVSVK
ncbi:hypothetical protein OF829_19295 [Sphingomonas sp. LB-2]|uniref:hypothetical protein n=1 Tax=Sphingomonas caeni TaxID=2984949 RepID=UPI0022319DD5|nr:hypothetical protein [Sphingomonas caeni]MCW3849391.1 hypothetical protein [Sphingomonas caeni]